MTHLKRYQHCIINLKLSLLNKRKHKAIEREEKRSKSLYWQSTWAHTTQGADTATYHQRQQKQNNHLQIRRTKKVTANLIWRKYYVVTPNLVTEVYEQDTLARQLKSFLVPPKAPACLIQCLFSSSSWSPVVQRTVGKGATSRPWCMELITNRINKSN